jgi:gas vesicle protein
MFREPAETALRGGIRMANQLREETESTEGGAGIAWFLTGAAIGAALAMLYAPKSGKDTRQYLSEKTREGRESIGETGKSFVEASKEIFERGRQLVDDAADLFERGRKLVKG